MNDENSGGESLPALMMKLVILFSFLFAANVPK